MIYSLLLLSQRQQTHALAASWLERLQAVSPTEEREQQVRWHCLKSTTVQEESTRYSTIIKLSQSERPWESPPPGVSAEVADTMGGRDIVAHIELVTVMDLDQLPASMKLTDEGL